MKELVVKFEDLYLIGDSVFENEEGNTCFILSGEHVGLEIILLRNILEIKNYSITGDYDSEDDLVIVTDMPWEVYHK